MLRFNGIEISGSVPAKKDFNTSYVTVQLGRVNKAWVKDNISIHPMLRFNNLKVRLHRLLLVNFNTSYVTVQQGGEYIVF